MQIPGVVNAWTMPIKARVDMLSTGVRTPVGVKILGPISTRIQRLGLQIEAHSRAFQALPVSMPKGRAAVFSSISI